MSPKQQRIVVQRGGGYSPEPEGFFSSTYSTLTSPENAPLFAASSLSATISARSHGETPRVA
ncbi:unnamed protein product [Parascedosporium putredinis]|uniref:Uncharacterized protein n=1 Tax=Parascedosporium putredinis TaxID=1442378 RepID=A0A9P1MCG1_9PEZI|nr:unnamed protein product [Parascedosporium putredinis]CAI7996482.1 unnamed protein product [Parascedosporium putredinis]